MRFFCCCLLLCISAHAQAAAFISGTVVDASGKNLVNVEVRLLTTNGKDLSTTTDNGGTFRFLNIEPGDYTVALAAAGAYPAEQKVQLRPRQHLDLDFVMRPVTTRHDEVTVQGMAPEIDPNQTSSQQAITHDQIEEMPAYQRRDVQSLAQALSPGAILSHDNFVHVRGNEMSLHQFINGVSFLDNSHQHFTPGVDPAIFAAASVVTGGFSAEYGNRFGGVFDINTRTGKQIGGHGSVTAAVGSLMNGLAAADFGGDYRGLGYYVSGNFADTARFLNPPQPEPLHDRGVTGGGTLQLDYAWQSDNVKFLFMGGADRFELPNDEDTQVLGRDAQRRLRSQSTILGWQHTFSPQTFLNTSAYERTVSDHVVPTPDPDTEFARGSRATMTLGIKSDLGHVWHSHLIKAGVDLSRLRLLEALEFDPRDPLSELPAFSFGEGRAGGLAAAYIQDKFSPVKNLTLDLGVRFDRYDLLEAHSAASPRAGIAYHFPQTHTVLHFAYSRLFTPPPVEYQLLSSFLGRTAADPDKAVGDLRPYMQSFYDAGIEQQITPKTTAEISLYKFRGKNAFENSEVGISRIFAPSNFGRSQAYGLEAVLRLRQFEDRGWTARLQYGAQRAFFYGPFAGGLADAVLLPGERVMPAFDEIHTGSVLVTYSRPRWRNLFWTGNLLYGSGTAAEDGAQRLPQHATGNFSVGLDAWQSDTRRLTFDFNIENVSDGRYQIAKESEETPIQYAQGRTVSGRLRFRF